MTILKLLFLALLLNLARYILGGPIEAAVLLEPMHRALPLYPEVWNSEFGTTDFLVSLGYNFALWFFVLLNFHLMAPALKGPVLLRSIMSFAVSGLIFASLAAVYMNHFIAESRTFFLWSIVDAAILFPLLAIANGLLYPFFFRERLRT